MEQKTSDFDRESAAENAGSWIAGWTKQFGLNDCIHKDIPESGTQVVNIMGSKLDELVQFCYNNGFEPILIATPFSEVLNAMFGKDFLEEVYYCNIKKQTQKGVLFLDYREHPDFQKKYEWFINGTCWLTEDGRRHFMQLLMQDIYHKNREENTL